jgi:hypothetical protein
MARTRSIRPDYVNDERFATLALDARLLDLLLPIWADDEGRFVASPGAISDALFPYDAIPPARVAGWLGDLAQGGLVQLYTINGRDYGAVTSWRARQKIDHPSPSRLPAPPDSIFRATGHDGADIAVHSLQTRVFRENVASQGTSQGAHRGAMMHLSPAEDVFASALPPVKAEDTAMLRVCAPVDRHGISGGRRSPDPRVSAVWSAYLAGSKRPGRNRMGEERRSLIEAALQSFPLDDILDAVRAWVARPEPMPEYQRQLSTLLRKPSRIVMFRDRYRAAQAAS